MKILMATSEAVPFAKTGGLADVCGALPIELAQLGHEPTLILPAYRQVRSCGVPIEPTGIHFDVPIGSKTVTGTLAQEPAARQLGAGLPGRARAVLRSPGAVPGARRGLPRQLRAVRVLLPRRDGGDSAVGSARSTCCTPTIGRPA